MPPKAVPPKKLVPRMIPSAPSSQEIARCSSPSAPPSCSGSGGTQTGILESGGHEGVITLRSEISERVGRVQE